MIDQHRHEQALKTILADWPSGEHIAPGHCSACGATSGFRFHLGSTTEINWRETLVCTECGLINRWRASVSLIREIMHGTQADQPAYITERLSPVYQWLTDQEFGLIGSEFISPETASGEVIRANGQKVMHQDVTRLSFDDASLSAVFTFDVLEHVADYRRALSEFHRVLCRGGTLVISVPFSVKHAETIVRATQDETGQIHHLLEPEYHGDPMSSEGVLCFYNFGWSLLDDLRQAGFDHVRLLPVWDPSRGYMGLGQSFVLANAPG